MGKRPLTLDDVPASMLAEYGLSPRTLSATSFRCDEPTAVLLPLDDLILNASRRLHEPSVRWLLGEIRDNRPIDAVPIFREPGMARATLFDGMHRWRVSRALGLPLIPCLYLSRFEAESGYGYAGQFDQATGQWRQSKW